MKQKTYRADTMKEARLKVKMDLGEDAKILETRRVEEGGIFGFMSQTVIEVDACLAPPRENHRQQSKKSGSQKKSHERRKKRGKTRSDRKNARSTKTQSRTSQNKETGNFERSVNEPVKPNFSPREQATQLIEQKSNENNKEDHTYNRPKPEPAQNNSSNGTNGNTTKTQQNGTSSEELKKVLENTDRLTEKVEALTDAIDDEEGSSSDSGENYPGKLSDMYRYLINEGVEPEYARELIGRCNRKLEADEIDDSETIRNELQREIGNDIEVADPLRTDRDDTLIIPFVGPTGVGKTTTMAKLAAYFSVEEGQSVSFITFDTYRLAAVEQLRCYADILQVPLEAVMSEEEFDETLEEFKTSSDLIFVDTAGRSQFDHQKIDDLKSMIGSEDRIITHLVLDATARPEDLDSILEGFDPIDYSRMVITKLDETRHHGNVINILRHSSASISYMTNGQDVPNDLLRLDSDEIAELVTDEDASTMSLSGDASPSDLN